MTNTLILTPEQESLRETARRYFERAAQPARIREIMASAEGRDTQMWAYIGGHLGYTAMIVPEEFGGAGACDIELSIVMTEMGRVLTCIPFFSTAVLACKALIYSGDEEACHRYLPRIASGSLVATVSVQPDERTPERTRPDLAAERGTETGWRLEGRRAFVLDGDAAELILAVASTPSGPSLFAIESGAPGLARTLTPTLDETRRMATVEFSATPATMVGQAGRGNAILDRVQDAAAILLASEQVGGAERILELTVDYTRLRHQFGRPIGSFQAVKHRCVDMLVQVESAKLVAGYGAFALANGSAEVPVLASMAKSVCSDAYFSVSAAAIQLHGGIGFTWDHPAHLYFKRAKSDQFLLGSPEFHREQLMQRIGV